MNNKLPIAKNFALMGAGGYIAPRHMKAIRDTGNRLVAACDPSDSVGILDYYSFDVCFFKEEEPFERYAENLRRQGEDERIHYVSICSPNHLHDTHIRFALRIGADAICEKPLVLNPLSLDALAELERKTGRRVFTILQLRVHSALMALREKVCQTLLDKRYQVDLAYITSRGNWYFTSWKGDEARSGGIAANIGVHFFDMLMWIFGPAMHYEVHYTDERRMSGFLELEKATVRWFLSIDRHDLPDSARASGKTTFRSIVVDGEEFEFSEGFTDLHTDVYRTILRGEGFGIDDARPAIDLVHELRNAKPLPAERAHFHPLVMTLQGRS